MKKWLMAVLLGTVLVLGACGGSSDDNDSGSDDATTEVSAAEDLYQNSCASCHGQDLSGTAGPDLTTIGNDYSADEIETIIVDGVPGMPAGTLTGDDAREVAEWLAEKK